MLLLINILRVHTKKLTTSKKMNEKDRKLVLARDFRLKIV